MDATVLITGANGNLGTATVKKFLEEGYRVIAVDGSDSKLQFAKSNNKFSFQNVDLAREDKASDFAYEIIKKYQTIHAAVLLVGGFAMGGIDKTTGADIEKMITLNFSTAFYLAKPIYLHMRERDYGRIILIGARPAMKPEQGKGMFAYSLSKSLLFRTAEFLNADAKGKNVVTSVIVPSTIDTPQNRESMPDIDPANWVKAEEIANLISFICSEAGLAIREPVYKMYGNS